MTGSNFLQLDATDVPRGQRTDWLTSRIRTAILEGTLAADTQLPPSRQLADEVGFSRGTVTEAYRRLAEEALIISRAGAGTTVARAAVLSVKTPTRPSPSSQSSRRPNSGVIDLATGLPDVAGFPRAAWLRAEKEVLATATASQLGYAPAAGMPQLRRELTAWLARSRGVAFPDDRLLVTAGVSGALSALYQVLRAEGKTTVAVEDPGANGNARLLRYWMPLIEPVPVDAEGLVVNSLAATVAQSVLVTPAHQYPTGVVLSAARRRDLVAWARDGDRLIIEDDYDAEYRYDRRPVRAVQPLAPESVAYTSSLSKTLAPGLRLGWLVPPARLRDKLVELRWATDLGAPAVPQLTLAALLRDGVLERHLRLMRTRHRRRRDATMAALGQFLPGLAVSGVAAGLHLVVRLPDEVDDRQVVADAREAGVAVQALSSHCTRPIGPGLIINYAATAPAVVESAIRTLARVVPVLLVC